MCGNFATIVKCGNEISVDGLANAVTISEANSVLAKEIIKWACNRA